MKNRHIKISLLLAMGLTLVGCSSTPIIEEKDNSKSTGAEVIVEQVEKIAAVSEVKSSEITADQLLVDIQGKVVNFEFDRSEVQERFYKIVKLNANYMALDKSATVVLQGHADERGTPEYNLALGEQRAKSVKNALIAEGVSPSRINTVSFGEENPVDTAHNEVAWSKNRRVEFSY